MEPRVGQEVPHARDHAADRRGRAGEGVRPHDARLLVDDRVPRCYAMRDRLVRVEAATGHAERDEEELAHRGLVRLAGDDLDEAAEDGEARVRVMPYLTNWGTLLELGQ